MRRPQWQQRCTKPNSELSNAVLLAPPWQWRSEYIRRCTPNGPGDGRERLSGVCGAGPSRGMPLPYGWKESIATLLVEASVMGFTRSHRYEFEVSAQRATSGRVDSGVADSDLRQASPSSLSDNSVTCGGRQAVWGYKRQPVSQRCPHHPPLRSRVSSQRCSSTHLELCRTSELGTNGHAGYPAA